MPWLFAYMGTFRAEVLADSPVRYYTLDDSTGIDTMGGSNLTKGTTSAAPGTGAAGQSNIGAAWSFDGGDFASFTMPSVSTTFTFECFFKTNGSTSKTSHTFWRSDGADVGVIRMQATNVVYGGEIYGVIGTAEFHTGTTYHDNAWHHLVVAVNGTSVKVYVDGVLKNDLTTGKSSYSFGSIGYLGRPADGTTSEYLIGGLDEVAIYNTTLSSTRVAAHYDNRGTGGYNAEVATGSGSMTDATAIVSSFTTLFEDGSYHGVVKTMSSGSSLVSLPGTGLLVTGIDGTSAGALTFPYHPLSVGGEMLYRVSNGNVDITTTIGGVTVLPTNLDATADKYYVRVRKSSLTQVQYKKWIVGAAEPAYTSSTVTSSPTASVSIDYDFQVGGGTFTLEYLSINTTGAAGAINNTITAEAATATSLMTTPVFSNTTITNVVATVAVGSGLSPDASIAGVRAPVVNAEAMTGSGSISESAFAVPISVAATAATGSGASTDVTVTAQRNGLSRPAPMTSTSVLLSVMLSINGAPVNPEEASDRYYSELVKTTDIDDFWYRLDETSGTVIHDARGVAARDADLNGGYSFGVFGPESRRAIHFDNGYFKRRYVTEGDYAGTQGVTYQDESDTDTFAFEVVLRTTDGNGMLAYGLDRANPLFELGPIPLFRNSIYLKDGKVSTNWNYKDRDDSAFELSGNTNVADGQWHHIVVAFNYGAINDLNSGIRIYIDGKLDVRRRRDVVPGLWASPDSYFGMPDAWRSLSLLYPWQKNFVGDAMEVVFRYNDSITADAAKELYYAAFGIVPIRVQPMDGSGTLAQPSGRGNTKRMLLLTVDYITGGQMGHLVGDESSAPSHDSYTGIPDEFNHYIPVGRIPEPGETGILEYVGYMVMPVAIMQEDWLPLAGPYRDPVTDLPRLINIQEDLDLRDYDVIAFRNWPDEGADLEVFYSRGYTDAAIEDFLQSVKNAVIEDRMSLEITNPNLAYRLGLITGAQPIPTMFEFINVNGFVGEADPHSLDINPWAWDRFNGGDGRTYMDTHANSYHRVTAIIEDLTDLRGEHMYDAMIWYDNNNGLYGDLITKFYYKLSGEPLELGTELLDTTGFWNHKFVKDGQMGQTRPDSANWSQHFWAITPDGLVSGTPLYKFGMNIWQGRSLVPNPYAEYIGGAVLRPGDLLDGRQINGKVFINLAERPFLAGADALNIAARQIVPPNEEIWNYWEQEDEEKREWDYSYERVQNSTQGNPVGMKNDKATWGGVRITWSNGKPEVKKFGSAADRGDGTGTGMYSIIEFEKYPIEPVVVPTWTVRGLAWLGMDKEEEIPGSVNVMAAAARSGISQVVPPVVYVDVDVIIDLGDYTKDWYWDQLWLIAVGTLEEPLEVAVRDKEIAVIGALKGSGDMVGIATTVAVPPMEGEGHLIDNLSLISAGGERISVTLYISDEIKLYILEDK